MNFRTILQRSRQTDTPNQILRHQLLWMMLLRLVLYTLLLGISYLFGSDSFDVILMPIELMTFLLLAVYGTSIGSGFYLLTTRGNLRKFGFIQALLDTVFATVLVYYTGISLSIFTSVYFFPIIAGGLILPRKGGIIAAASSTLLYGSVLFLEAIGFFPGFLDDYGYQAAVNPLVHLNQFSIQGLTFFLAAVLSGLFSLRVITTETALSDSLKNYDRLAILYKQIFENIATGIITVDDHNTITSANNATAAITGYTIGSLIGKSLSEQFPELNLSAPRMRQSTTFNRQDGKSIRLGYSHVNLYPSEDGKNFELEHHKIITLRDISEIEQLERQMRQAEKLAAIGTMSASIAHDFRNPLAAISGSAQILANEFSESQSENLANYELTDIILRESNRMIDTIADFLKFSRPEIPKREWFLLNSCLDEVIQVATADPSWPSTTRLELVFNTQVDIWADRRLMFTVFTHLIQNALSFCPPGNEHIQINAREIKEGDAADFISISVSDNGPGVADDCLENIFEPFFTSRADGTGLGLAIVRQIIEEHDGDIRVDRSIFRGAKFTILLPLPS